MSKTKFTIAASSILLMAGALAMDGESLSSDSTITAVAALRANLGGPAGLDVDEVRITDNDVACIEYRLDTTKSSTTRGHAVVQRDEVITSSSDYERFEKAWNEHCLGPRGGMSSDE